MNGERQQLQATVREAAAELRRLRRMLLLSFAGFCVLGGSLVFFGPTWMTCLAFLSGACLFFLAAVWPRLTEFFVLFRDEVHRQHGQSGSSAGRVASVNDHAS